MSRTQYRDPRELERDAAQKQADIATIVAMTDAAFAKSHPGRDKRDYVMQLSGQVKTLEQEAAIARDRERGDAEASVRGNGRVIGSEQGAGRLRAAMLDPVAAISTTAGGTALVPSSILQPFVDKARDADPINRLARRFSLVGGSPEMRLPKRVTDGTIVRAGEADPRPVTSAPTFDEIKLETFDRYGRYEATRTWVESTPDAENLILQVMTGDIFDSLALDFAVGDGAQKPKGLFTNTTGTNAYGIELASVAGAVSAEQIIAAYTKLRPQYRVGAVWLMNSATLAGLTTVSMPSMSNTPLVQWEGGVPRMLGLVIEETTNAPSIGTGTFPIALANLDQAYAVGVHTQGEVTFFTENVTDPQYVKAYGLARVGGVPWNNEAAILLSTAIS